MSTIYSAAKTLIQEYGTDPVRGLTSEQVHKNSEKYGANELSPPEKDPLWKQYIEKFKDPTIIILCICAVVAIGIGIYHGGIPWDGVAILIAVCLATGVSFWSEYKADQAFELLKEDIENIPVKVTRNGAFRTISIKELVVGDIIHLEVGDKVPADAVLINSVDLMVDESLMTGESVPVHKGENNPKLIGGTYISDGEGLAVVTAVGDKMEMGAILKALGEKEEGQTPLQQKLGVLAGLISVIGTVAAVLIFLALFGSAVFGGTFGSLDPQVKIVLSAIVLGASVITGLLIATRKKILTRVATIGGPAVIALVFLWVVIFVCKPVDAVASIKLILDFFIIAVTIIVVAVPEGLPMAVTISLALSMRKIRQDNNLVRKMLATETIGSATVICSDKTGTLTKNQMEIQEIFLKGKYLSRNDLTALKEDPSFDMMKLSFGVNSTAYLEHKDGQMKYVGNPTEGALLAWLEKHGISYHEIREIIPVRSRICFTAERKMMTSVIGNDNCGSCPFCALKGVSCEMTTILTEKNGCRLILTKGAPERVFPLCTEIEMEGKTESLASHLDMIEKQLISMTDRAIRPLAIAYRAIPKEVISERKDYHWNAENAESDLTLLCLVGISDPVREDVPDAIRTCERAGIDIKMITGDHMGTARAIAEKIGLLNDSALVLDGNQFSKMSDEELMNNLPRLRVLARSNPLDKERLVELLQRQKHVVAVTGDGTNDAPALKKADVGISMGLRGTDVAKEASDIVLTDDNFGSIVKAVHWGRSLYENVQKFLQFQLTINLSALCIAFLSPILKGVFPGLKFELIPLTVLQLLWINLIMDTLAALALGLEPPRSEIMEDPPKRRDESFVTRPMLLNICVMGMYFTLLLLLFQAFDFLGASELPGERAFSSAIFTTYVFLQVFNLFNARSVMPLRSAFLGILKSRSFLAILALVVIVQVNLTQFGGPIFNTQALPLSMWVKILLLASTTLLVGEAIRVAQRYYAKGERYAY